MNGTFPCITGRDLVQAFSSILSSGHMFRSSIVPSGPLGFISVRYREKVSAASERTTIDSILLFYQGLFPHAVKAGVGVPRC